MKHIHISETDTLMRDMLRKEYYSQDPDMVVLSTDFQTTGRGQHDHKWESARGENLILGIIIHPSHYPVAEQKRLSDDIANCVCLTLNHWLIEKKIEAWVKQPNDIYVGTKKIAGLLIEHDVQNSTILTTRIGLGININQTVFLSDAPNPCSLASLLSHPVNREEVLVRLIGLIENQICTYATCLVSKNSSLK